MTEIVLINMGNRRKENMATTPPPLGVTTEHTVRNPGTTHVDMRLLVASSETRAKNSCLIAFSDGVLNFAWKRAEIGVSDAVRRKEKGAVKNTEDS